VISGFLITYTLSRNYSRDLAGNLRFYRNRFVRIYSLYWPLVIVAFLIVPQAWDKFATSGPVDKTVAVFLIGFDWGMIIAQNPYVVGLSSAWTLAPELFFYLVAPFLMRSRKTGLGALVIFLGVRLGFVAANGTEFQGLWTYMFAPSSYCFFLLGHVVCLSSARWRSLASPVFGVALLLVSFGTMAFAPVGGFDGPRFWASVLCFTLALPGFFRDEEYTVDELSWGFVVHRLSGAWHRYRRRGRNAGRRAAASITVFVHLCTAGSGFDCCRNRALDA
jgi:peptidoglycan/LPS O-acetylase OafA/YrhL